MSSRYRFIDTHCHLDFPAFEKPPFRLLANCEKLGIGKILVPAVGRQNWHDVLVLAEAYPQVSAALGIHPCFLACADVKDLDDLAALIRAKRNMIVALGEIGLDRAADISAQKQRIFFYRQLSMAAEFDLPVMIHSRRMNDEVAAAIKQIPVRSGVVHGFSGSVQQAHKLWALGMKLGVGGVITYSRASKTRRAIAEIPLEALVLETDAPDMPLSGFQGHDNTPERLPMVFDVLCKLRSEEPEKIAQQLYRNSMSLFFPDMPGKNFEQSGEYLAEPLNNTHANDVEYKNQDAPD